MRRVYHGTALCRLESIRREGLRPQAAPGGDAWLLEDSPFQDEHDPHEVAQATAGFVFVATDFDYAAEYAHTVAEYLKSKPVVVAFDVDESRLVYDVQECYVPHPTKPDCIVHVGFEGEGQPCHNYKLAGAIDSPIVEVHEF